MAAAPRYTKQSMDRMNAVKKKAMATRMVPVRPSKGGKAKAGKKC